MVQLSQRGSVPIPTEGADLAILPEAVAADEGVRSSQLATRVSESAGVLAVSLPKVSALNGEAAKRGFEGSYASFVGGRDYREKLSTVFFRESGFFLERLDFHCDFVRKELF
jgi:hypothetical protein